MRVRSIGHPAGSHDHRMDERDLAAHVVDITKASALILVELRAELVKRMERIKVPDRRWLL